MQDRARPGIEPAPIFEAGGSIHDPDYRVGVIMDLTGVLALASIGGLVASLLASAFVLAIS
jgi:hypothetical protein